MLATSIRHRQYSQIPDKPQFGSLKDGKVKRKRIIIGTGSSTLKEVVDRQKLANKNFFKSLETPVPVFGKLGADESVKGEDGKPVTVQGRTRPKITVGDVRFGDPNVLDSVVSADLEWAEQQETNSDSDDLEEDMGNNDALIRKVFTETPYPAAHSSPLDNEAKVVTIAEKPGPTRPAPAIPPTPRDLFEELFPEEVQRSTITKEKPSPRPKVLEDFNWNIEPSERLASHPSPDLLDTNAEERAALARRHASILVLGNASKSLALSDFLRLSPRGQHIEGWTSGLLQVIPGRDPRTLLPTGVYYILFSSITAARTYHDRVTRLHYLSRTYTPTGPLSSIAPPPGYLKDGEDIHKLMSEFTLIPPSQRSVHLKLLSRPSSQNIEKLIANGGHSALIRRQAKCPNLVLINISDGSDYGFVSEYEVRRWLVSDGKARGLAWGLIDGMDEIVRLDGRLEEDEEDDERDAVIEGRQKIPNRFVLSFKEDQEARRFVREWHKRGVSFGRRTGQDAMVIDAELLW